ncbi:MAG TPA: 5,10-methylenetetrahydrofolate reductase [Candidatus Omnitrophica bacterium]|nr:5,10-methylenetetrahydrofolate reductase [Candidatus Omnitrophota bacterium]
MIITKQKTQDDILRILSGKEKIFIIGCGDCAATCKTGGEDEVAKMADFLKSHGKAVTGTVTPDVTCVSAQAKVAFAKNREALKLSEAILVLACGSGVQCVKENDRFNLDVYPGCDSMFSALIDKDGSFREVCSSCGECLLDLTEGICPVTRCSKGVLNGPCGGQNKGKCEVDRNKDCAWVAIYKRLKEKGKLENLKRRHLAKNRSHATKPGHLSL